MTTITTTPAEQQQIATTILEQLGGRQFLAMTGSKDLVALDGTGGLKMKLTRNKSKAQYLFVTYMPARDLYTVEFKKVRTTGGDFQVLTVAEFSGVEATQLQPIFTSTTGLYTKL